MMFRDEVTAKQRENALFARDVMWPSIPVKNVIHCLAAWRARRRNGSTADYDESRAAVKILDCKTLACLGGWVAANPYFRKQGVKQELDGCPYMLVRGGDNQISGFRWSHVLVANEVAGALFGDEHLFDMRQPHERGTDHAVVQRRLNRLVRNSVVAP